ncbi:MAG: MFS transporter [Oscillospiraceae bacterium]|jgi:MFS family permease|nr:MFS transporter [Oscillospiraceae bacterium]
MFGVARGKRAIMWTILLIAMVQMPHLGLSSGANSIREHFGVPDATAQIAVTLPALLSTVSGFIFATLIRRRAVTKKTAVVAGVFLVGLTGAAALLFHSSLWHVYFYNALIGTGMGAYIPNAQSIAIDTFDGREFQMVAGIQSAFINGGGIILSLAGGFLVSASGRWSTAYAMLLVTIPIAAVALRTLPREKRGAPRGEGGRSRRGTPVHKNVRRYTVELLVFMIFYGVLSSNIAIHIDDYKAGDAGTAGVALAFMMAGGVAAGFAFQKLSSALRENMGSLAHAELFAGYMLLGSFPHSKAVILAASFIVGLSLSTMVPHCIFSASRFTDPSNSATATMMIGTLAPGTGGFLSPVIMTNVTGWLFGTSTSARFIFAALASLALAAALFVSNAVRARRRPSSAARMSRWD